MGDLGELVCFVSIRLAIVFGCALPFHGVSFDSKGLFFQGYKRDSCYVFPLSYRYEVRRMELIIWTS